MLHRDTLTVTHTHRQLRVSNSPQMHVTYIHIYTFATTSALENETSPAHLLEHQRALPRPDGLRQLGDAALVEVRPREAAVVDEDLGAAVAAVGWRAVGVERGEESVMSPANQINPL